MMQPSTPMHAPQPLGLLVVLVLSLWAAARDSSYKRAGGLKPDRFAKSFLLAAIAISITCLAVLYVWSHGAAGTRTASSIDSDFWILGISTGGESEKKSNRADCAPLGSFD